MDLPLSEISRRYGMARNIIQCDARSKKPTLPNWADDRPPLSDEQLDSPAFNKGLVLLNNFAVLDVDDYAKAQKFLEFYGVDLESIRHDPNNVVYHNNGPSSSAKDKFKVLFARPADLVLEHINKSSELGLELRTGRCQDILPGSVHPDGGVYVMDNMPDELPAIGGTLLHVWKSMLAASWRKSRTPQGQEPKEYERLTDAQMQAHLDYLPSEWVEEYETWWKVGAALQRAHYPYELWAGWSKTSPKWNPRVALGKWNTSFGGTKSNSVFTIASIIKAARDNGYTGHNINDLLSNSPDLSKLGQPFYTEEEIAAGQGPDSEEPEAAGGQTFTERRDGIQFFRDEFVYISGARIFYHTKRRIPYTSQTLGPALAHLIRDEPPSSGSNGKPKPFNFNAVLAVPGNFMPVVDQLGFEPGKPTLTTTMADGEERRVFNECFYQRPRGVPPSKETTRILQAIFDHYCEGGKNTQCAKVLTNQLRTLHYKMDHPAARFNYGHVLISPVTGTGKSFFSMILPRLVFGDYVRKITVDDLESAFDASHKARNIITCIEEVKLGDSSADRFYERESHKVMNKLKDWMTSPVTSVNEKGEKKYSVPNCTAMFVTSNFVDCIPPQGAKDRRWIACVSHAKTLSQENPQLDRDSYDLMKRAETDELLRQEIIGWIETFDYKGKILPNHATFSTEAVAAMADMAETSVVAAVRELYGPDRPPNLPTILTREQVLTQICTHTGNPNIVWGRAVKSALISAGASYESLLSRHHMQGNRVVQGPPTKTCVVFIRGRYDSATMLPSDVVKQALESSKPSLAVVP
jgi:hypothetical protein